MTFHIEHCTVHIPRGGKFTIGGVTTNRHKLLSLKSKQPNIYHCTVCITIMAKFTNYWLLPCRISYTLPYLFVYYLSDLKLRITWLTTCSQLLLLGCHSVPGVGIWIYVSCTYWSVTYPFWLCQPFVEWYVSAVLELMKSCVILNCQVSFAPPSICFLFKVSYNRPRWPKGFRVG